MHSIILWIVRACRACWQWWTTVVPTEPSAPLSLSPPLSRSPFRYVLLSWDTPEMRARIAYGKELHKRLLQEESARRNTQSVRRLKDEQAEIERDIHNSSTFLH